MKAFLMSLIFICGGGDEVDENQKLLSLIPTNRRKLFKEWLQRNTHGEWEELDWNSSVSEILRLLKNNSILLNFSFSPTATAQMVADDTLLIKGNKLPSGKGYSFGL